MIDRMEPSIVNAPIVEIRGGKYPLEFTCGSLMKLARNGINLLDRGPYDPNSLPCAIARQKYFESVAQKAPSDVTEKLFNVWKEIEEKLTPERKAWVYVLDEPDPMKRMEIAFAIIAEGINSNKSRKVELTPLEIAEYIDINQAIHYINLAFEEVGKFLDRLYGRNPGQTSEPATN